MRNRLLIVDDDVQFCGFLQALLEKDYELAIASNGRQALGMLDDFSPDLILTDLVMPELEGIGFIRQLKADNSTVPVIVMSGGNYGDPSSYLKAAKMLGATRVFKKPVDNDELVDAIRTVLLAE